MYCIEPGICVTVSIDFRSRGAPPACIPPRLRGLLTLHENNIISWCVNIVEILFLYFPLAKILFSETYSMQRKN